MDLNGKQHAREHSMTGTNDHSATANRLFYSDSSGDVQELAFGASGEVLSSSGVSSAPTFEVVAANTGWINADETWVYQSVDDPTGIVKVTGVDVTSKYSEDMKIKFVNGGNTIFGVITVVALSGSDTLITFIHEVDPSDSLAKTLLANSAITDNYYSTVKNPYGFPMDRSKWTVVLINDTSNNVQGSGTVSTWYNGGGSGLSGSVPIGRWIPTYNFMITGTRTATSTVAGTPDLQATLSSANNSESDSGFTVAGTNISISGLPSASYGGIGRAVNNTQVAKPLSLTSKTTYYLNARIPTSSGTLTNIGFRGDVTPTLVKLILAAML